MPQKNFRAFSTWISGDGSLQFAAGPAEQLGGIGLQNVPADLAAQKLSFAVGLDQPGTHQLFNVVRDGSLGDGKFFPELGAGAGALAGYDLEHLHAPGIGQRLGDELELFVGQGRPSCSGRFHGSMVIELSYICQEARSETYRAAVFREAFASRSRSGG